MKRSYNMQEVLTAIVIMDWVLANKPFTPEQLEDCRVWTRHHRSTLFKDGHAEVNERKPRAVRACPTKRAKGDSSSAGTNT